VGVSGFLLLSTLRCTVQYFFLCKGGPPLFSAFFFLAPLARLAVCSGPTARDSGRLVWFLRSSITQAIKFKIGCQVMRRLALLNAAYGKASKGYRSIAPFRWHDYRSYKRLWISATSLEQFSRHLFVWYTVFSPNQIQPCTPGQTAAAADHCAKKLLLPVATSMKQWCRRCISLQPTYVVPFG